MNFGKALKALKQGRCVAREGWNGKNMFLFLFDDSFDNFPIEGLLSYDVLPCICIKTATNDIVLGWHPSQLDMLATDWIEVEI